MLMIAFLTAQLLLRISDFTNVGYINQNTIDLDSWILPVVTATVGRIMHTCTVSELLPLVCQFH